ncbi:MAG TPA: OsmC family protein [Salinimicrobium sp.]|nr:OsmC family protein [Salinimicrobium sp.]
MTSKVKYLGDLRTSCEHVKSGSEFITDAPVDNKGKGEAFSPTDTVATALASCMLTVMGIKAQESGWNIENTTAEVTKTMASNPRRISKIEVDVYFPSEFSEKEKQILEKTALTCPVLESLSSEMEKVVHFHYGNI